MLMHVWTRDDHNVKNFLKRTIAAQLHAIGFVGSLVCGVVLLYFCSQKADSSHVLACVFFIASGALVFLTSASYHFLHDGFHISSKFEHWLENLDHSVIYMFIAGTYTPFVMNAVHSSWQIPLLCLVWGIGLVGIVYTNVKTRLPRLLQHRVVYTALFVLMGWTALVRFGEIISSISAVQMSWLLIGGLSYTLGAVVYVIKWPNIKRGIFGFHEIWHVAVMLGFACHYVMVLRFYL